MASPSSPLLQSHTSQTTYHTAETSAEDIADAELTEEELREYERGIISWRRARRLDFWCRRDWVWGYVGGLVLIILVALMSFFHHRMIDWAMPVVRDLRTWKFGWLIPIGLIVVLSFPPLFGNEIVIILVGLVWGLGKGTGIVAAGVIIGESAVYGMFSSCCRERAEKMTKKDLNYACLSEAIVEGGFPMAWIVRLSVIPTHFTTAVLAICGLRFYHFLAALVLGLPKQIVAVYAGTVLAQQRPSMSSRAISGTVFFITAIMTILALRFIYKRMTAVRKKVLLAMRDDLRAKGVTAPAARSTDGSASERSEDTIRPRQGPR